MFKLEFEDENRHDGNWESIIPTKGEKTAESHQWVFNKTKMCTCSVKMDVTFNSKTYMMNIG